MPDSSATADARVLDRALGAYLGLAIGDALGATVEFMTPREIVANLGVHRDITGGGWLKLKAGQVTDDTTMALALGDAIVASGGFDARAAAEAFADWLRAKPVDCGNACRRGIRRYLADGSVCGPYNEGDGGNGAVMRCLPVPLAALHDAASCDAWNLGQAHITHNHALSDAATVAFGRMTRRLVLGEGEAALRAEARDFVAQWPKFTHTPWPGRASGYVVDTVQTVLHHVLGMNDFEQCLIAVVNCGDDADTTGALAGMLAGARCGASALPARWLDRLDAKVVVRIREQVPALLAVAAKQRPR
ncbi:ADP-ribosyl-[dinitrogen reductase] hydrolase [Derxia gummosa]|uniref:ADP-ribosyl-[dinitrogen reductase] hydrolase n=1 Tax=Derxia gummosa DSM 723 TaxID=1121388 RepID=A0A8B6X281_9BURK|nr:ADP-ribosyl-[dinitrogen reductase] hydrolase [Derxia gummosa]